jgi:hypothetical protein
VRHHPGDDKIFDLFFFEEFLQPGVSERVRKILLDDRLPGERLHRGVDLRAARARQEESRPGTH